VSISTPLEELQAFHLAECPCGGQLQLWVCIRPFRLGRKCSQHPSLQWCNIKRSQDTSEEILSCRCRVWTSARIDDSILRGPIPSEGTSSGRS
jgi:hypothetical protein